MPDNTVLVLGKFYRIKGGHGVMRLDELPDPPRKVTITFRQKGGVFYWAFPEQILSGPHETWEGEA